MNIFLIGLHRSNKDSKRCFMRMLIVYLIICNSITILAQSDTSIIEIYLSKKTYSLENLIEEIENTTDIRFAYSPNKIPLKNKVKITKSDYTISELLELISSGLEISYLINGNQIALSSSKPIQNICISGYVEDATTGERLIAANIYNNDLSGTISNNYGYYSFTQPAKNININYSYIGYKPVSYNFSAQKDTFITIRLYPDGEIDEVHIYGREDMLVDKTDKKIVHLPHRLISSIPTLLGEGDILKAIQLMPGTQSGLENTNGVSVRGGGTGDNIMLIDGVKLYHSSHLLGLLSIINSNTISSSKLIKSGIPAYYGGRTSSLIDLRLKEGNLHNFRSEATLGFPNASILLEGPFSINRSSFLISGRSSFINTFNSLLNFFNDEGDSKNYRFSDIVVKINHKFSDNSKIYFSMYSGSDKYDTYKNFENYLEDIYSEEYNDIKWSKFVSSIRWNYRINEKLFLNATFSNSNFKFNQQTNFLRHKTTNENTSIEEYEDMLNSSIEDFTAKLSFDFIPNTKHYIKYGYQFTTYYFEPNVIGFVFSDFNEFYSTQATTDSKELTADEHVIYIDDGFSLSKKLSGNYGVRASLYSSEKTHYIAIEPRFSANYNINDKISLFGSATHTVQNIHLLNYTNLVLPTDLWVNSNKKVKPQSCNQFSFGYNFNITDKLAFSSEVYHKKQYNIISYSQGPNLLDVTLGWEDKITTGSGTSYGIECMLQKTGVHSTGWISYTLSKSTRKFEGETFLFQFDKPHILNIVYNQKIGKNVELGATWIYTTGQPFTFNSTSYQSAINDYYFELFNTEDHSYEIDYVKDKYNERMLDYHRLDLSIKSKRQYKFGAIEMKTGVYNAYNRHNPVFMQAREEAMYITSIFSIFPFIQLKLLFDKNLESHKN